MKLLCKAKTDRREITFGKPGQPPRAVYIFEPNEQGELVCEVPEPDASYLVRAIPEHFEEYREPLSDPDPVIPQLNVIPATDFTDSQPAPEAAEERSGSEYNGLTRKQLEKAYEAKFGKKPHPNAKDSTLLAKLTGNG